MSCALGPCARAPARGLCVVVGRCGRWMGTSYVGDGDDGRGSGSGARCRLHPCVGGTKPTNSLPAEGLPGHTSRGAPFWLGTALVPPTHESLTGQDRASSQSINTHVRPHARAQCCCHYAAVAPLTRVSNHPPPRINCIVRYPLSCPKIAISALTRHTAAVCTRAPACVCVLKPKWHCFCVQEERPSDRAAGRQWWTPTLALATLCCAVPRCAALCAGIGHLMLSRCHAASRASGTACRHSRLLCSYLQWGWGGVGWGGVGPCHGATAGPRGDASSWTCRCDGP